MVAADHDRRFQLATSHHLVEREAGAMALSQSQPADARRQSLEGDPLARHVEPAMYVRILGKQFFDLAVGPIDVFGVTRQRNPAKRTLPLAEQRPDVRGNESGKRERIGNTFIEGDLPDVVAVIERRDTLSMERK